MRDPAHWFKPLLFFVSLLPLMWLVIRAINSSLGVNPVETLQHELGGWALKFLFLTLFITPLRLIPGWNWLLKLRRMLGLYAFFYATLHLAAYIVVDQQFDWTAIIDDIVQRTYIAVGLIAYLLFIPLVITSHQTLMKRGGFWKRLHRLIYVIVSLGVAHYYLTAKSDTRAPLIYATILVALIILRFVLGGKRGEAGKAGSHRI